MRVPLYVHVLALGVLNAGSAMAAAPTVASATPSLTLYEKADFAGRHVIFHGPAENARQAFDAKSARSTGVWTLCEGREPASGCQTVTGPVAKLKIAPAIVRPGVDAVALYEEPGLKGRRVVYSFASDQAPPFRARSARTWGGPWSLCAADDGRCQVIDGERSEPVEIKVGQVKPGRPPERLRIAMAPPPPEPPPVEESPAPPAPEIAAAAPPAPPSPAAPPAPVDAPPPQLAEASPPREAEPALSPYVDIPLPPRERDAPRPAQAALPPPAEPPVVRIPIPQREAPPSPGVRRVSYACEDGQGLTVLFDDGDQSAMVLAAGRSPLALRRSPGQERGGFFYEGAGHVLFGAGARAGYASDGAEPVDCYVRGAPRQLSYRDAEPRSPADDGDR